MVGKPFSTEKYGIGLPLADKALRDKVNASLETSFTDGTWKALYDETLGKSGAAADAAAAREVLIDTPATATRRSRPVSP